MYFCVSNESYYYLITTKQLVFPIDTDRVLCKVRKEFLRIISVSLFNWADLRLWLSTDEFPTRRLQFDPRPVTLDFSGGQSSTGTGFPRSTSALYCQYYSTNASILIFFYTVLLSEGQAGKAWEPSKKRFSSRNRRALDTKGVPRRFPSQSSKD